MLTALGVHADMTESVAGGVEPHGSHSIHRDRKATRSVRAHTPFTDGKVCSSALGELGPRPARLSPMVIRYQQRRRYLRSLERANQGNRTGLIELFTREVSESINRFGLFRRVGDG
jgi:hypothetical protein